MTVFTIRSDTFADLFLLSLLLQPTSGRAPAEFRSLLFSFSFSILSRFLAHCTPESVTKCNYESLTRFREQSRRRRKSSTMRQSCLENEGMRECFPWRGVGKEHSTTHRVTLLNECSLSLSLSPLSTHSFFPVVEWTSAV